MHEFFCLRCSRTSFLDERFCCIHCGNELRPWIVVANNLNLSPPVPAYAIPGCYEPASNACDQKTTENLKVVERTREVSTQTSDDDFPLQIAGRNGYENCSNKEKDSQNKTSRDLDQYDYETQNRLQLNSNAEEGEFHDHFYEVGYAASLVEVVYDQAASSKQTYLSVESSFTKGENRNSDEFLRTQGSKETTDRGMKCDSFALTDSNTLESSVNLLSDSSYEVEDRHEKDNIPPSFSSGPRRNKSVSNCFQANEMAQQKPETSGKRSKRWCADCGRCFFTEWTFKLHKEGYCNNSRNPYKCEECGEIFLAITNLFKHKRIHTKPFKCT